MKRGAEKQITKDDREPEEGEEVGEDGGWKAASKEKMAARKVVKARRKGGAAAPTEPEAAAAPATAAGGFTFGAAKTEGGFNFDFSKKAEPAAEEKPAAAPAVNAFAALVNKSNWECPSCMVSNKESDAKCAACEAPREAPKAAPVNAFAALVNKSNWECPACMVSNKESDTKCAACETPKAGAEEKKETTSATTFGAGFKFTPNASFNFDSAATAAPGASTGGFTFGGDTSKISFGAVTNTGGFGSGGAAADFTPAAGFSESADSTKKEFKDKKPTPSGTENDTTIFKINTKVFVLKTEEAKEGEQPKKPKFTECGEGELNVNTCNESPKMARLVLRAKQTQRLVLNAPLFKDMTLQLQGEKFVKFCSSDTEGKPAVYLLKVKSKAESSLVLEKMKEAIAFLG